MKYVLKYLEVIIFYPKLSKKMKMLYHLCFSAYRRMSVGIYRKPGGTEVKWDTQLLAYADDVNLLGIT
jgi:hypothetical protein